MKGLGVQVGKYKIYAIFAVIFICLTSNTNVFALTKAMDISENLNNISEPSEIGSDIIGEPSAISTGTIYLGSLVTGTANGDGLTPQTATNDAEKALRIVPAGGTIELVPGTNTTYIGRVFIDKNITFRGTTGDERLTFRYGINMNANLTIENINVSIGSGVAIDDIDRGKIFVNGNTLNIGKNVKTIYTPGTGTNYNLAGIIYAGSENKDVPSGKKSVINIQSGNFAKIIMTGGSFSYIDYGIVASPANMYGDVEINITGGAIGDKGTGGIYSYSNHSSQHGNEYLGNTKVTVRGSDITIGEIGFGTNKGKHTVNLNSTGHSNMKGFYNIDELIINGPSMNLSNMNPFAGVKSLSLMPGSSVNIDLNYADCIIEGDFYGGGTIRIGNAFSHNLRFNGKVFNNTIIDIDRIDFNTIQTDENISGTFTSRLDKYEVVRTVSNGRAYYKLAYKKPSGHSVTVSDTIVNGKVTYEIDTVSNAQVNWVRVTTVADPGYKLKEGSVKVLFPDGTEHQVLPESDEVFLYIYPDSDTTIYATFELDGRPVGVKPAKNLRWDRNYARFDASDEANEYEVILYKNRNTIKTIKTNELFVDFDAEIIKFGTEDQNMYQFSVKALAPANSQKVDSAIDYSGNYIAYKPINNIEVKISNTNMKEKIEFNIFKIEGDKYIKVNSSVDAITNGELLYGLDNGKYITEVYSKGFLKHTTQEIILNNQQSNTVLNIELSAGDNDSNNIIDSSDRYIMLQNFGMAVDATNRYLDYDGNNNINTLDLGLLLKNTGKSA